MLENEHDIDYNGMISKEIVIDIEINKEDKDEKDLTLKKENKKKQARKNIKII